MFAFREERFDLTPRGIIEGLDLLRPINAETSAYGHFGRAPDVGRFPWDAVTVQPVVQAFV